MPHILQETVVRLVQLLLVSVCMCLTVYVEMGLPGKTIETLEQNHNINRGWAAREHYIPYND